LSVPFFSKLWTAGRRREVPDLRLGDAQLIDLRDNPVVSLDIPFDSLRFYIPQIALDEMANEAGIRRVKGLHAPNFGGRDCSAWHKHSRARWSSVARAAPRFATASRSLFLLTLCAFTAVSRSGDGAPADSGPSRTVIPTGVLAKRSSQAVRNHRNAVRDAFTPAGFHDGSMKPVPDWTKVHQELKRRGVTLMLLWEEHRAEHVEGHGYSRFCELYGEWRRRLAPTMRQTHVAGDKLFVDWAGDTVPIIDAMTGEVHDAHLFVAALRRVELHLRRGALEREAARPDRCARQRVRFPWRCAEGASARQSQSRHYQAVALRAGRQQDVSGSRRSLR
jgi:hypothetical protein